MGAQRRFTQMEVVAASASHRAHPASAVVDGDAATFWATTGCFPHEAVIRLPAKTTITRVVVTTTNAHRIAIDRTDAASALGWQAMAESDAPETGGRQTVTLVAPGPVVATHLRLRLLSGHGDFVAVHGLTTA